MTIEWSLAAVQDVIAEAVPDPGDARVEGRPPDLRRGGRAVEGRWPASCVGRSIGLARERDELERWECGQVPVALVMHNRPEYVESMLACYRARAVPFNVNHQYNSAEIRRAVRDDRRRCGDLPAVVRTADRGGHRRIERRAGRHRRRLGRRPAGRAASSCPTPSRPAGARACRCRPATTSTWCAPVGPPARPRACCGGRPTSSWPPWAAARRRRPSRSRWRCWPSREVWFAAPPFMHAAAQWTAYAGLHMGATVVMHDDSQRFDAAEILDGRRARARQPHVDRRRRLRPPDGRGAAARFVRPELAASASAPVGP